MSLKGFTLWLSRESVSLFFPTASDLSKDKENLEHSHAGRYDVSFIAKETLYFLFLPSFSFFFFFAVSIICFVRFFPIIFPSLLYFTCNSYALLRYNFFFLYYLHFSFFCFTSNLLLSCGQIFLFFKFSFFLCSGLTLAREFWTVTYLRAGNYIVQFFFKI